MKLEMTKTKFTGMDGRTVVAFTQKDGNDADPFTIVATPSGVYFKGVMKGEITNSMELDSFAKLFSDVWTERQKLRPVIAVSPSGH